MIKAAQKLCKQGWNVTYVEKKRGNYDPWMHLRPDKAARREVLSAFMNLELALESDAWVCTPLFQLVPPDRRASHDSCGQSFSTVSKLGEGALQSRQAAMLLRLVTGHEGPRRIPAATCNYSPDGASAQHLRAVRPHFQRCSSRWLLLGPLRSPSSMGPTAGHFEALFLNPTARGLSV